MKMHEWDDEWISSNYPQHQSTKNLWRVYIQTHDDAMSYDTFKWHCRVVLGLQRTVFHMSEEQEQFIIENFEKMSVENLRKTFNKKFNMNFKTTAFHYHTKRIGLDKWTEHVYTDEQEQFLAENAPVMIRRKLTQVFNETFNTYLKEDALVMHCWQRGYGALNNGRFSSDRQMTVFVDGDPDNFDENNVKNVDLKTFAIMNNNGWLNSCAEIVKTALLWCQLLDVLGSEVVV